MARKPPQNAKRDMNEPEVFKAIRDEGITVEPTDQPLDALCGFNGYTFTIEVKNGPKAPLTDAQVKFLNTWPGQSVVLTSEEEAILWSRHIKATYKTPPADTWKSIGDLAKKSVEGME